MKRCVTICLMVIVGSVTTAARGADWQRFSDDIWPIFAEHCISCHGESEQEGELRLDSPAAIREGGEMGVVIKPGDAAKSPLFELISMGHDDEDRMPKKAERLPDEIIERIGQWIGDGAEYDGWSPDLATAANLAVAERKNLESKKQLSHWAYSAPSRPGLPKVSRKRWVRNPIDRFILAKLDANSLRPSQEADRMTLLRRLSLDLTGLPPTLDEAARVMEDAGDRWYGRLVERLLGSPHYGERWARHWLDGAQYADSDGYEKDKPRRVSAWRDWVIEAFNRDMPYDQFIIEQVAGDMLPDATDDQRIATGFLRNSMINEEGGINPEQFRMEAMFNRMDVIGQSVLGLTVNCAQCHSHKYDPLTHTEYYRMMAYLNNFDEATMTVWSDQDRRQTARIEALVADFEEDIKRQNPDWRDRMKRWEDGLREQLEPNWQTLELEFDDTSAGGQRFTPLPDGSYIAQGYAPTLLGSKATVLTELSTVTAIQLEQLLDDSLPRGGPGRSIYGGSALSEFYIRTNPVDKEIATFKDWDKVEIESAVSDINPPIRVLGPEFPYKRPEERRIGPVNLAFDGNEETAWTTDTDPGQRNRPTRAIFRLKEPLVMDADTQLAFGLIQRHGGQNSNDNQTNNLGRFRISVTGESELPDEIVPEDIAAIVSIPFASRSEADMRREFSYWCTTVSEFAEINSQIASLRQALPSGNTQLVTQERRVPRETHRLERGEYLSPAEAVEPGTPAYLHTFGEEYSQDRLGLAQWLVSPDSPTTARSYVNRVWHQIFGEGFVSTTSDFGLQGEAPSHPELLDWLSVEFMDSGWSIKDLHRLIVSSATYRQESVITPDGADRDPQNRLLARGARFRVDGEIVRDIALVASGLLNPVVGGDSVFPPVPEHLYKPPASFGTKTWHTEQGINRYRRGLYTFRFRSVPYPVLQLFDAPSGNAPCTRRDVGNTPLQALATLNEELFVECAIALAAKTLRDGGATDRDRITYAFRRCVTRSPDDDEAATLLGFLEKQRVRIADGQLDASTLLASAKGDAGTSAEDPNELAAWMLTSRVLLNLDETIIRQ